MEKPKTMDTAELVHIDIQPIDINIDEDDDVMEVLEENAILETVTSEKDATFNGRCHGEIALFVTHIVMLVANIHDKYLVLGDKGKYDTDSWELYFDYSAYAFETFTPQGIG